MTWNDAPSAELELSLRDLRDELVSAPVDRRRRAAELLRGLPGRELRPALPELIAAVWDTDATIRSGALDALAALGPAATVALPAVARALDDPDPEVRRRAASTQSFLLSPDGATA